MFRLTPLAETDIEEIALHIAIDSPSAALRWWEDMLEKCRRVGEMPQMGIARPDVRPDLRTFVFSNYLIVYRKIEGGAEIIRVIHGARQWQKLL
jgi:toxin ParE1/3/4